MVATAPSLTCMDAYRQKNLSLDDIYRHAPQLQLQLVAGCFDTCVQVAGLENGTTAADFYKDIAVATASKQDLKTVRMRMTAFLRENSKDIYIADGGTKSRKGLAAKAEKRTSHLHSTDINRLTILSKHVAPLDAFAEQLGPVTQHVWECDEDLSHSPWTMNKSGFVVRQANYFIDGLPMEICQREEREFWLCQAATYPIYQVWRMSVNTPYQEGKFSKRYALLPKTVADKIEEKQQSFDTQDQTLLLEAGAKLDKIIAETKNQDSVVKKQALLDFEWETHALFNKNSPLEWQAIYRLPLGPGSVLRLSGGVKAVIHPEIFH